MTVRYRTLQPAHCVGCSSSHSKVEFEFEPSSSGNTGGQRQQRRGRDSNPSGRVGDNFKRHATLHANARKSGSKRFGSLSPLVAVNRRESSGVGQGFPRYALSDEQATAAEAHVARKNEVSLVLRERRTHAADRRAARLGWATRTVAVSLRG